MFFVERILALAILALLAPFFVLVAIAIVLESRGPVLFRQARVGRGGRGFMMWKFRTMRDRAQIGGARLTERGDRRITRLGAVLRRLSIDELPNLVNVVLGEMSFVGPRPEIPEITAHYTPRQREVLAVRPGLTGFAAVLHRQEISVRRKLELERIWLRRRSFRMNAWILWKTVGVVLTGRGNR